MFDTAINALSIGDLISNFASGSELIRLDDVFAALASEADFKVAP